MSVSNESPIVVFGANGQLGSELQREAARRGMALHAISRSAVDIADAGAVAAALERVQPSLVVNAAAYTRVDDAESEREKAMLGNVTGPKVLAECCAERGAALIHISSDYVFDGTKRGAYSENDQVAPIGFYGKTKAYGEEAVRNSLDRHVILRVSWLYGEFGSNFLKTMLRLASQREEISVVADQHGCPTSTRDVTNAILAITERVRGREEVFGTYHFAGDGATTWHGFASAAIGKFAELNNKAVRVKAITTDQYPTRTKRPENSVLSCEKFERVFGFRGRPWQQEVEEVAESLIRTGDFA